MKNKISRLFIALSFSVCGSAYAVTMTGEGIVGDAIATINPTGTGATSGDPVTYDAGAAVFDMDQYGITRTNGPTHVLLSADSITSDTNTVSGGLLNFSSDGPNSMGSLQIDAITTILLNSIDTRFTAGANRNAGSLAMNAGGDIVVAGPVRSSGTYSAGGSSGSPIEITSSGGSVRIGGDVDSTGSGRSNGYVTMQGTSLYLQNIFTEGIRNNGRGGSVTLTATSGLIESGTISAHGGRTPGDVTLTAAYGDVTVGSITNGTTANESNAHSGGTVTIVSGGAVQVDGINSTVARVFENALLSMGGNVDITASNNVLVAGAIDTYVNNGNTNAGETARSSGGNISITSETGDISIQGAIDASSPAGEWNGEYWHGDLTLTATEGAIELASLDVDKVGDISFVASLGLGTTILGEISGIDSYLNTGTFTVSRFGPVTGNIYYDPAQQSGTLAAGQTFQIDGSEPYYLTVIPEPGTLSIFALGLGLLGLFRRHKR